MVAKILSVQESATQVTYRVDDGTGAWRRMCNAHASAHAQRRAHAAPAAAGKCELKMWVDNDDPEGDAAVRPPPRPPRPGQPFSGHPPFRRPLRAARASFHAPARAPRRS